MVNNNISTGIGTLLGGIVTVSLLGELIKTTKGVVKSKNSERGFNSSKNKSLNILD